MPEPELSSRVTVLEAELVRLDGVLSRALADSVAARTLAARADRDSASVTAVLRGHTATLNALRQDQADGFAKIGLQLSKHEAGFLEIRTGFAMMAAGFEAIHDRLDRLAGES